jgi:hypothetical protein
VMCYQVLKAKPPKPTVMPMLLPFNDHPPLPPPLAPPLEPPTFPTYLEYTMDVQQLHKLQHNGGFPCSSDFRHHVEWICKTHLHLVIRVQCMWRIAVSFRHHVEWICQNHLHLVIRVQCGWQIAVSLRIRNTRRYYLTSSNYPYVLPRVTKCQSAIRRYLARC